MNTEIQSENARVYLAALLQFLFVYLMVIRFSNLHLYSKPISIALSFAHTHTECTMYIVHTLYRTMYHAYTHTQTGINCAPFIFLFFSVQRFQCT